MTLIKRVGKALAVIVVVLAVSGFASHQYVNHVEKQRPIVTLAKHSDKVLFFYRDDCPDCQAIFHQIYWHNVISHNIILINMNQPQNRHYIQKYQLTAGLREKPCFWTRLRFLIRKHNKRLLLRLPTKRPTTICN